MQDLPLPSLSGESKPLTKAFVKEKCWEVRNSCGFSEGLFLSKAKAEEYLRSLPDDRRKDASIEVEYIDVQFSLIP